MASRASCATPSSETSPAINPARWSGRATRSPYGSSKSTSDAIESLCLTKNLPQDGKRSPWKREAISRCPVQQQLSGTREHPNREALTAAVRPLPPRRVPGSRSARCARPGARPRPALVEMQYVGAAVAADEPPELPLGGRLAVPGAGDGGGGRRPEAQPDVKRHIRIMSGAPTCCKPRETEDGRRPTPSPPAATPARPVIEKMFRPGGRVTVPARARTDSPPARRPSSPHRADRRPQGLPALDAGDRRRRPPAQYLLRRAPADGSGARGFLYRDPHRPRAYRVRSDQHADLQEWAVMFDELAQARRPMAQGIAWFDCLLVEERVAALRLLVRITVDGLQAGSVGFAGGWLPLTWFRRRSGRRGAGPRCGCSAPRRSPPPAQAGCCRR